MSCYKPNTQEENYVNVAYLYRNFWNDMHAFVWEYQDIQSKYYNTESAYNAFWQGRINPYCYGAEAEMRMLAYKIYGYSINVFEIVAYSLECWKIQQNSNPKGSKVTDKQYDQGMFMVAVTLGFDLFKGKTDDGFHFIQECSPESIAKKGVIKMFDMTPETIITETTFRDKAMNVWIPFEVSAECM